MSNLHEGWYLIYTKPCHERKVHARLSGINIQSLLPMQKTLRIWHDRKKFIDQPLFPSYIFVYLMNQKEYYDVMDLDGVLHYVRSGKEVARISKRVIENIMIIAEQGRELEVSDSYFEPGQQVMITEGPLTGLTCEIVQNNNKRKLLVRVDLLQRNVLVTLPVDQLAVIS
jgi:transcriptional antiterminator RfaH